jgi:hypothetical protein
VPVGARGYLLYPLIGAALALIFYLVVRGGFLTTASKSSDVNVYSFRASHRRFGTAQYPGNASFVPGVTLALGRSMGFARCADTIRKKELSGQ